LTSGWVNSYAAEHAAVQANRLPEPERDRLDR
jgi:hypothetical protein